MTTLQQNIASINESARRVFGVDISVLVARAVSFGNDDNLIIVKGVRQEEVAADIARTIRGAKIEKTQSKFMGSVIHGTTVQWA